MSQAFIGGHHGKPVTDDEFQSQLFRHDHELVEKPSAAGQQLLFYARFINLRKGDVSSLKVRGPLDFDVDSAPAPLDHSKATFLSYTGKKAPPGGFAKGPYFGHAKILRNGKVIAEQAAKIELE